MVRTAAALTVTLLLTFTPVAQAAWRWPLRGPVARPFAVSPDRFAAGQHRGVDLAAPPGTPVRAACSGRVRFAGRVARLDGVVSVRCGGLIATYVELGAVATARGRPILAGQRVGAVGSAAHLHLGARDARRGRYVDPLRLLREGDAAPPPLGPAPAPARRHPQAPAMPSPRPRPAPASARPSLPPLAWAGLALVAAGLPLGGLVAAQRSRQRRSWTSTSAVKRSTSSAR